ncbi:nucleotide exchange factor GrpE [Acinetobacter radioresistens]|uniref:Protein GrpE n=1 Tax=Acinetobacter radioresistens TaxID=40216 RepID=A0A3D3FY48_ACIRA|nr:nucleotide exchange factor GrpE [Acinetobacter radioresistens]MCK4087972.1 nucleotide exchange factor GrpE [Acinetobacter radioresistens]MCK4102869.1 nucleotide exchange factor GrpE [Acinetobacter radioresistens]MCX0331092.1 nucleotide exchange factor GrpE [Acinetobacter radioresistens]HCM30324.1 nucleotide exchange factor GrpE [Acinetobacter radioresistens]
MANEQNEQAQNPQEEQLEAHDQQTQAESSSGHLETDSEDLKAQITKLEESLKLEKARAANAIYESEKVKERLEREAETAKKFALEKFAKNLLETVDNLERALQATGEEQTPLSEGVELTLKGLLTTLEKAGVVVVDTANGFNADLHQAVGIDPNAKSGEIGTVLQKGYTLSGRLLRPAMVMVGQ